MTLQILISTLNDGIENVKNILLPERDDLSYLIIHQTTNKSYDYSFFEKRNDVKIIPSTERGLTKSRNLAIKNLTSDIGIIADDDVNYTNEQIDNIKNSHLKNEAEIILFKINCGENLEYKKYSKKRVAFTHKSKPHYVSSIEITFKRDKIKNSLAFDERFGLGSIYPGGEEEIFIHDALMQKLTVLFIPIKIVQHPLESSGKNNDLRVQIDAALDSRINGYYSLFNSFKSFIKNMTKTISPAHKGIGFKNSYKSLKKSIKSNLNILIK
ncbi:glycosyltransferase [Ornithobacterium rhinotracheale]|uniref:glycosyltransferase n=1 Tax=Ornithobacterium rhinotracheale TaxID=28251 RepID=UPI003FA4A023